MKKVANHHTVADWDFSAGMTKDLSVIQFVSPPSSIHLGDFPNNTIDGAILCRIAEAQCIPEGRIVTWARQRTPANQYRYTFRNQAVLGSANSDDCYQVQVDTTHWYLYRYVGGAPTLVGTRSANHWADYWAHHRVSFYNGQDPLGIDALVVIYEREIDGVWTPQDEPIYDPVNMYKDSPTNRLGLVSHGCFAGWEQWYDDTEIWQRV